MTDDLPVVVIGAGPIGLAAAAHLLERGPEPAGPGGGAVGGDVGARVGPRAAVLPLGRAGRPGRREAARPDRLDRARRGPRTRPAAEWAEQLPAAAGRRPRRPRPLRRHGHRRRPRAAATGSSTPAATTEPLHRARRDRRRPRGADHRPRRHRRLRHLGRPRTRSAPTACPPSASRPRADRIAYRVPDLDDPRRPRPLRRQAHRGRRLRRTPPHRPGRASPTSPSRRPARTAVWVLRRGDRSATPSAAATPTSCPPAAPSACAPGQPSTPGTSDAVTGFRTAAVERDRTAGSSLVGRGRPPIWTRSTRSSCLTGFRPDLSFLSEVRLDLDPRLQAPRELAPLIDPNVHSCGTVYPHGAGELAHPEHGVYLVGMKSYGRAPTFLAMTGYEQVRSVAAALAGDHEAAERVELVLPETGVCGGAGLFDDPTAEQPTSAAAAAARPSRSDWRRRRQAHPPRTGGTLTVPGVAGTQRRGGGRDRNAEPSPRLRAASCPSSASPRSSAGASSTTPSRSSPRSIAADTGWSTPRPPPRSPPAWSSPRWSASRSAGASTAIGPRTGDDRRVGPRPSPPSWASPWPRRCRGSSPAGSSPASPWPAPSTRPRSPR